MHSNNVVALHVIGHDHTLKIKIDVLDLSENKKR
jgi:hypothetical protein